MSHQPSALFSAALENFEYERYSRQLTLPRFGLRGQLRLSQAKVIVVGCGALGCPVALYLAGAGIGTIGLLDDDTVEVSNLHRQIGHTQAAIGTSKVDSLASSLLDLNSTICVNRHPVRLTPENAECILAPYDILVDATDNVATRYLLSDVAVLQGKPLVSGAALRYDGQLTTYNYRDPHGTGRDASSLCYRCLHPTAPLALGSCSDYGVLGAVPGMIGCLQAIEVITMIAEGRSLYAGKMLIFSGSSGECRLVRLRSRRTDCSACGETASLKLTGLSGAPLCQDANGARGDERLQLVDREHRISSDDLRSVLAGEDLSFDNVASKQFYLIDVRPYHVAQKNPFLSSASRQQLLGRANLSLADVEIYQDELLDVAHGEAPLLFVCRRGNDSQRALHCLLRRDPTCRAVDLIGGVEAFNSANVTAPL